MWRRALVLSLLVACTMAAQAQPLVLDPVERAASHPIERDRPGPDFFEGALLGNGGLGAVVTTRPDAVVVRFGHNNVWDIRVAEANKDKIGTFQQVFEKVMAIPADAASLNSDPWAREYIKTMHANYDAPYPRPFPCGSFLVGFDRRNVELLGYRVDIARGLCTVDLLVAGQPAKLEILVEMAEAPGAPDRLWLRAVDAGGQAIPNCFDRVRLLPDPQAPKDIPGCTICEGSGESALAFRQVLPFSAPVDGAPPAPSDKDRAFRLSVRVAGAIEDVARPDQEGQPQRMALLERGLVSQDSFVACVQLDEGLASAIGTGVGDVPAPTQESFAAAATNTEQAWHAYWNRSAVALDDPFLEQVWYWNHYFFNCATKAGVNCPGLFANWSFQNIGTSWHGDYHMNYNTQQPFWLPFASNRVEKDLAYVELVERLLPLSQKWAREYYGLRGAYFPHSAYPVEMTISPYPVPTWGWEICETPWAVQGLWWHYIYTMDTDFLRYRAYVPIREAVLFLVDYMKRPEAHGAQWSDDKYHVFPTVPPELYGLKPGFKYNNDCLVDLTLIKFVMKAYLEAVRVLNMESEEAANIADVRDILAHFPAYPTAKSKHGDVFVSVPGEHAEVVFNVPNSLMTVFPGEDHGLDSPKEVFDILANTWRNQQNEGGNELVFLNLQGARLGLLDLDRFRRQINYCMTPNGTCADMVLQVNGRYDDATAFDFMRPMGVWFENFSLPAVINECLMQSYTGTIRLFPNWPLERPAAFKTLRAVGAFLVSARCAKGEVEAVEIQSEAGQPLRLINPWKDGARMVGAHGERIVKDAIIQQATSAGEIIKLTAAPAHP